MATNTIGGNSPTLTISGVTKEKDGNQYYCEVTDANNQKVTSRYATLTVLVPPFAAANQPTATPSSAEVGDTITVTMELTEGSFPITYSWYKNDSQWASPSVDSLSNSWDFIAEKHQSLTDTMRIRCEVSNAAGEEPGNPHVIDIPVTSATGTIPVAKPNQPTADPEYPPEGGSVALRMELESGTFPIFYEWVKNGVSQGQSQADSLVSSFYTTFEKAAGQDVMVIECNVSNNVGSATTNPHTKNISSEPTGQAPQITTNIPSSIDVEEGQGLTLTVEATGDPAPSYTWYEIDTQTLE